MKILCKLPNASSVINGVKFIEHKLGMISEEVDDAVGEHFLKIEGYMRVGAPAKKAETTTVADSPDASSSTGTESAETSKPAVDADPAADAATKTA